jgi:hypothetical protein
LLHSETSASIISNYTDTHLLLWDRLWPSPSFTKATIPSSFLKWIHTIWLLSHWANTTLYLLTKYILWFKSRKCSFTVESRQWINLPIFYGKKSNSYFCLAYYWLSQAPIKKTKIHGKLKINSHFNWLPRTVLKGNSCISVSISRNVESLLKN